MAVHGFGNVFKKVTDSEKIEPEYSLHNLDILEKQFPVNDNAIQYETPYKFKINDNTLQVRQFTLLEYDVLMKKVMVIKIYLESINKLQDRSTFQVSIDLAMFIVEFLTVIENMDIYDKFLDKMLKIEYKDDISDKDYYRIFKYIRNFNIVEEYNQFNLYPKFLRKFIYNRKIKPKLKLKPLKYIKYLVKLITKQYMAEKLLNMEIGDLVELMLVIIDYNDAEAKKKVLRITEVMRNNGNHTKVQLSSINGYEKNTTFHLDTRKNALVIK